MSGRRTGKHGPVVAHVRPCSEMGDAVAGWCGQPWRPQRAGGDGGRRSDARRLGRTSSMVAAIISPRVRICSRDSKGKTPFLMQQGRFDGRAAEFSTKSGHPSRYHVSVYLCGCSHRR